MIQFFKYVLKSLKLMIKLLNSNILNYTLYNSYIIEITNLF